MFDGARWDNVRLRAAALTCALFSSLPNPAAAEEPVWSRSTLNLFGSPGLIDMPSAHAMPDADGSITVSAFEDTQRNTFHFQITPRLSGAFRYSYINDFVGMGRFYDRSFDLRYLLAEETARRPALTVGLQDFGGTGVYGGEYIVATKTFGRVRATGGLGWGRFGSSGGFDNPLGVLNDGFNTRPGQVTGGQTGRLDTDHWFRGDAAFFGGLQYLASDRLVLTAEYSSDAYERETTNIGFDGRTQLNLGATYRFKSGVDLRAAYLYGTTFAVQLSYTFNPKTGSVTTGGLETAPPVIAARPSGAAQDLGWTTVPEAQSLATSAVSQALEQNGLVMDALDLQGRTATLRFRNPSYRSPAQAVGRAARVMANVLPASVETLVLVYASAEGLPLTRVSFNRSDLEEIQFEFDASWTSYARSEISSAASGLAHPLPNRKKFNWVLGTYTDLSFFDPDSPVRADLGLKLTSSYRPAPGFVVFGQVKHRLFGNRDGMRGSDSVLPRVRSDIARYASASDTTLPFLAAAYYFKLNNDIYGRITAGYLEEMFGGISGEVLWKPVDSNLALGIELNSVRQREFDQKFEFRDYGVNTGHISGYLELPGRYLAQVDVGRYLAGDSGATFSLSREFANGFKIGAFATFTDVPFDQFGEGSFDKGFTVTVPLSAFTGRRTKAGVTRTIRPITRDGGARLSVNGRLYEQVREGHLKALQQSWGRFWR